MSCIYWRVCGEFPILTVPSVSPKQSWTDYRGCRNVSKLITAFRERDQVIIVMPYHVSDDFRVSYPSYRATRS